MSKRLPVKVLISLNEYLQKFDDEGDIAEAIANHLSDDYGFCIKNFSIKFDFKKKIANVSNIEWDMSE